MDNFKPGDGKYRQRAEQNLQSIGAGSLTQLYRNSEYLQETQNTQKIGAATIASAETQAGLDRPAQDAKTEAELEQEYKDRKKNGKDQAAKHLIRSHKIRRIITTSSIALVALFVLFLIFRINRTQTEAAAEEGKIATADEIYYSPLSGNLVDSPEAITATATCVIIDNAPEARPQSGIDKAGVIYELIAEGGVTRLMAIFQETKPQFVGPVRSIRLTFAEFAKPYECSLAHVGGAQNALDLIRDGRNNYRDIDAAFYEGDYYWRQGDRSAPHNVYTSFDKLDKLNSERGHLVSTFNGFNRIRPDTIKEAQTKDAQNITINISSDEYNVEYEYDSEYNNYRRSYVKGGKHNVIDEYDNEKQLTPDVVVAIKVEGYYRSGSLEGYQDYINSGSNEAYIFQDGTVTTGKWQRENEDEELKFINSNGELIPLNQGQVWITAFPSDGGSVSWE